MVDTLGTACETKSREQHERHGGQKWKEGADESQCEAYPTASEPGNTRDRRPLRFLVGAQSLIQIRGGAWKSLALRATKLQDNMDHIDTDDQAVEVDKRCKEDKCANQFFHADINMTNTAG